jgi:hypothetical protein
MKCGSYRCVFKQVSSATSAGQARCLSHQETEATYQNTHGCHTRTEEDTNEGGPTTCRSSSLWQHPSRNRAETGSACGRLGHGRIEGVEEIMPVYHAQVLTYLKLWGFDAVCASI